MPVSNDLSMSLKGSPTGLIAEWRTNLLNTIMKSVFILATLVMITVILSMSGDWGQTETIFTLSLYVFAYVGLGFITFLPQIPYPIRAGALVLIMYAVAVIGLKSAGLSGDGRLFLIVSIVMGAILFGFRTSYALIVLALGTLAFMAWQFTQGAWFIDADKLANTGQASSWMTGSAVLIMLAVMLVASMNYLLGKLNSTMSENLAMVETINRSNQELEVQVAQRTEALAQALQVSEQQAAEQARLLQELHQQRELIYGMSVPLLPVTERALVMPLIGALDSHRLDQARDKALQRVKQQGSTNLIIDVTGVPVIDSQVAQGLLMIVRSCHLLGAKTIMVGVRPEVAQTIVSLGVDLSLLETRADLHSALNEIFQH
jgi:anti-anti-sigma regulatory factor